METNLDKVRELALDLRTDEPRAPETELAGFPLAARCLDKCRASLVGLQGDFEYGCPMDQKFLSMAGIDAAEFKEFVATGAQDKDVEEWIRQKKR